MLTFMAAVATRRTVSPEPELTGFRAGVSHLHGTMVSMTSWDDTTDVAAFADSVTERGPVTWDVLIPTDDDSIARRRRALAPTAVLYALEQNKSSYGGDHWGHYDLFNLALGVIDQVALASGISSGRTWNETVAYAAGQAARQHPAGTPDEWDAVAERVVVSLVTSEVVEVPYLVHRDSGPEWRSHHFRLLFVSHTRDDTTNTDGDVDGSEHLRASEQAVNIFLGALDVDVEAAQLAAETQLAALIERGAVRDAVQYAHMARYQSVKLQEKLRRIIHETLLDPDSNDWIDDVPEFLDKALQHVTDRVAAEVALLDAVAEQRGQVNEPAKLSDANQLVEILRDCRHRHDALHGYLISARSRLRAALDDRFSRPVRTTRRYRINKDLLGPYMAEQTKRAVVHSDRVIAATGGIHLQWWPSLAVLTDDLCAPAREDDVGTPIEETEFAEPEPDWWEPYEDTAVSVIDNITEPTLLSQALNRLDSLDTLSAGGDELDPASLRAAVVHAAHRAWAGGFTGRSRGDEVVVAVTTGQSYAVDGIVADDLLLVPAVIDNDVRSVGDRNSRATPTAPWDLQEEVAG